MNTSISLITWDSDLIKKYDMQGPRYTSYPTAVEFKDDFDFEKWFKAKNDSSTKKLSIYIHIPFCSVLCFFCACNKIVTRNQSKSAQYVDYLIREIKFYAPYFKDYVVHQVHFGGGSPNFLMNSEIKLILEQLQEKYTFSQDAEISTELDPRATSLEKLATFIDSGCNRISLGVQDFDSEVQKVINRNQNEDLTRLLVNFAREKGILSVNLDLIYGLPNQTTENFDKTLNEIIDIKPDRISIFNYAHMPSIFPSQKLLNESKLPSANDKLVLLRMIINKLIDSGYSFIGMDHFALPEDELSKEQIEGRLHRNFQGYTTRGDCDLLGMGVSAISQIGDSYSQNQKNLDRYYEQMDKSSYAISKGVTLNTDDKIRRKIIKELICNFCLDITDIELEFKDVFKNTSFREYFKEELLSLNMLIDDELLIFENNIIQVSSKGRLLIRSICMIFDYYTRIRHKETFSKVI